MWVGGSTLGEPEPRRRVMTTIREVTYDILRQHGLTTFFGNPGSNELTFLDDMPGDFRYILGLHEGAVMAMRSEERRVGKEGRPRWAPDSERREGQEQEDSRSESSSQDKM